VAEQLLTDLYDRIAPRFARSEPRRRARQYVAGLTTDLARKNGWTLAEQAGDLSPDGMQRLLRSADWDVDGVRDDVRDYLADHLGDAGELIVAEAGFAKKGRRSAGVARQFSATSGRVENCQVGIFLVYRSGRAQAIVDRRLYLPAEWAEDRPRCRAAGIGDDVTFAGKARIGDRMLARARAAGLPGGVPSGDDRTGGRCLRQAVRQAGLAQYQVRGWRAWHAHMTLSMAALAWLTVTGRRSGKG